MKHLRTYGIVALIALAVWALPGGGTAAGVFGALLFVVLTVGFGLFGAKMYLENRAGVYGLGDRNRAILYASAGLVVVTLAAGPRLFDTGLGTLVWIALLAAAVFGFVFVIREARTL